MNFEHLLPFITAIKGRELQVRNSSGIFDHNNVHYWFDLKTGTYIAGFIQKFELIFIVLCSMK